MINEPLLDYKFIPPCPPSNKIKVEEAAEIASHIDDFIKRGGKITHVGVTPYAKEKEFIIGGGAFVTFPELGKVKAAMREQGLTIAELAYLSEVKPSLLKQVLECARIPDGREARRIIAALDLD